MVLGGKRALITGATSGIGLSIAEEIAKQGADIVLSGFGTVIEIEALKQRLHEHYGVYVIHIAADLSIGEQCRMLAEQAQRELGSIDILINNAGIQHVAPVDQFPKEQWDAVLAVNLSAAFHLIASLLPSMRRKRYGRIINIASVHGLVGSVNKAAYVAAKHGLVGLTKVTALETAGSGVTCNAICPGWVLTPLVEAQILQRMEEGHISRESAEQRLLSDKQPSGEFVLPAQVGALAAFLCSDAAANITGASLPIDGAWTAQ
ncbi:3-hydroxybutyrate dehydrogenase [Edaphobacter flagellatus]|uniref:3-hydroxybutyrate dehydrogenase n=1 Tax=Edaphobacter flagellatus TaxID=1933044 RepID=UPI0021B21523|nr:3-hydroxybutyrate dehydrogenase [Edaphobacter flagellatus]